MAASFAVASLVAAAKAAKAAEAGGRLVAAPCIVVVAREDTPSVVAPSTCSAGAAVGCFACPGKASQTHTACRAAAGHIVVVVAIVVLGVVALVQ